MIFPSVLILAAFTQTSFEVPFRLGDGAIVLDATVNGRDLSLMFDSGFGGSVVANDNLNIGEADGTQTMRDFVGEYSAKTVRIKSFELAGHAVELGEPEAVEQPAAHLTSAYNTHTDGILGLQAIENYVTEINFQEKKLIFHPKSFDITGRTPDNKRTFMENMLPIGANSVELTAHTTDGQRLQLALDTGNSFYATINRDVLERLSLWKTTMTPKYVTQAAIASGPVDTWLKKMDGMTIFGVPVATSYWEVINLPSSDAQGDGTVGIEFLKNFNITIDYNRREVWLENFTGKATNDADGETGILARASKASGDLVVVSVILDSPADKAGIKKGDHILEVDSVEASPSWTMRQIAAKLEGAPGTKVQLAVSHLGVLTHYSLDRAALFN
jgi:hypothetical protein